MTYYLIYSNGIGGSYCTNLQFSSLGEAQKHLQKFKKAFEMDCDDAGFLDCIRVESDTPTHYEATDGEDWIDIRILKEL